MKKLLLILTLFVGNSFAEEEYPIELTCEIGENIIFFSLGKSNKDSWFQIHKSNINKHTRGAYFALKSRLSKKNFLLKKPKIFDEMIVVNTTVVPFANFSFLINRLTGRVSQMDAVKGQKDGNCFKGFKKYREKKF